MLFHLKKLIIYNSLVFSDLLRIICCTMQKDNIVKNIADIRGRISAACEQYGRNVDDITLVAVSKTRTASEIRIAVTAGILDIGENRIQDAEPKILEVGSISRFHMLGHLQTNKVRKAVKLFDVIQSLDSLKLAEEIDRRAKEENRTIECFIEVNCSLEEAKFGARPDEAVALIEEILSLSSIRLTGLMTIAPFSDDEGVIRPAFERARELFLEGQAIAGKQFKNLSMGMSGDFHLAIAEGSTMVRVGTGIFGSRQSK